MNKAIFLDRDGTINVDFGYVANPKELKLIDGVIDALYTLQNAGFLLIIITNQSGIGRGYFSEKQAMDFNRHLINKLNQHSVTITDAFMCIHAPEEQCLCRKPSPKLVLDAIKKYDIDPNESFMLGDKNSDTQCGSNAGITSFLIDQDHSLQYWATLITKNLVV